MPVADDDICGVLGWISSDTRRFRKLLLRAKASTVSYMSIVVLAEAWHNYVLEQCNVFYFPPIPGDLVVRAVPDVNREQGFKSWCGCVADSFNAIEVHSAHRHGFRRPEYAYLNDTEYCKGCLKTFHTKFRLLGHLSKSKTKLCIGRLCPVIRRLFGWDNCNQVRQRKRPKCCVSPWSSSRH